MAYGNVFYTIKDLNKLSRELDEFIKQIGRESHVMMNACDDAGRYWNDDQYRAFSKYMSNLDGEIESCKIALERSKAHLDEFIRELLRDA